MSNSFPRNITVTAAALKNIIPCHDDFARSLASNMNAVFPLYRISDSLIRVQMTIAQLAHESQNFTRKSENLNYSAQALANTWPGRFAVNPKAKVKVPNEKAKSIARKPELIAEAAYGGRLGNNKPGDAWLMRGAGNLQLTGKDVIAAYAKYKGVGDAYTMAEMLRTNDLMSLDSACWFLTVYKNCLPAMDRNDFVGLTELINGGRIGLEDRMEVFELTKRFIK